MRYESSEAFFRCVNAQVRWVFQSTADCSVIRGAPVLLVSGQGLDGIMAKTRRVRSCALLQCWPL